MGVMLVILFMVAMVLAFSTPFLVEMYESWRAYRVARDWHYRDWVTVWRDNITGKVRYQPTRKGGSCLWIQSSDRYGLLRVWSRGGGSPKLYRSKKRAAKKAIKESRRWVRVDD